MNEVRAFLAATLIVALVIGVGMTTSACSKSNPEPNGEGPQAGPNQGENTGPQTGPPPEEKKPEEKKPARVAAPGDPPYIPHTLQNREGKCLMCHKTGVKDAPKVPQDHLDENRTNDMCLDCHEPA